MTEAVDNLQLPTPIKGKGGRPEIWNQDIADYICTQIMAGMSLRAICEREDMPSLMTVVKWRRTRPSFADQYAQAREDQADTYADMMLQITQDMIGISDDAMARKDDWKLNAETGAWEPNHDTAARSRVMIEARKHALEALKWTVSKLKPGTYGERVEAKLTGEIKHAHLHAQVATPIDASALDAVSRDALRAVLLGKMAEPVEEEDNG